MSENTVEERKTFLLFCTPKCAAGLEIHKLPEPYNGKASVEIVPTIAVYMNLMDPTWTEAECDNVVYLVEKESFFTNFPLKFKKADGRPLSDVLPGAASGTIKFSEEV